MYLKIAILGFLNSVANNQAALKPNENGNKFNRRNRLQSQSLEMKSKWMWVNKLVLLTIFADSADDTHTIF